MPIIEIFKSIQGEGQYIGIPSIFIRFPKCNLKCSWCDTKYSWNEEGKYKWTDAIKFIKQSMINHIVFTGGEPLLARSQEEISDIIRNTMVSESKITIETNGTIMPDRRLQLLMKNRGLWSVSPKLQFMETHLKYCMISTEYSLDTLHEFDSMKNLQWKFVISDIKTDIEKIAWLLENGTITASQDRPIIIQPNGQAEGINSDLQYNRACQLLADHIINNNMTEFRVLPQFHKICWGNRRGI